MAETAARHSAAGRRLSVDEIHRFLAPLKELPTWWLTVVIGAAALSCIKIRYDAAGWTVAFDVTAVTVGILAFAWLPFLVSAIALAGGSGKTPMGEFATGGLLSVLAALPPDTQKEALPPLVAALDTVEGRRAADDDPDIAQLRAQLEERLAAMPPVARDDALEQLAALAREYEELRTTMPADPARTYRMTVLLTRARALGRQAGLTKEDIAQFLAGSDGERIVGLAVAQGRPDQADPEELVEVVRASRSAFEQYAALEALAATRDYLTPEQRSWVATAIREELERPDTYLQRGTDRYGLARALLAGLEPT